MHKFIAGMRQTNLIILFLILPIGCGPDHGRLEPQPVSGKVIINGIPAAGCTVAFVPVDTELKGKVMPGGKTLEDGSFSLTTHETGDGAPVGQYGVTLNWEATTWPTMQKEMQQDMDGMKPMGPDRFRGRFASPDKSQISVSVETGENELEPFRFDDVKLLPGTEPEAGK